MTLTIDDFPAPMQRMVGIAASAEVWYDCVLTLNEVLAAPKHDNWMEEYAAAIAMVKGAEIQLMNDVAKGFKRS